jgi:hypothetical protein
MPMVVLVTGDNLEVGVTERSVNVMGCSAKPTEGPGDRARLCTYARPRSLKLVGEHEFEVVCTHGEGHGEHPGVVTGVLVVRDGDSVSGRFAGRVAGSGNGRCEHLCALAGGICRSSTTPIIARCSDDATSCEDLAVKDAAAPISWRVAGPKIAGGMPACWGKPDGGGYGNQLLVP